MLIFKIQNYWLKFRIGSPLTHKFITYLIWESLFLAKKELEHIQNVILQ